MKYVLDSSVALKTVLPEEGSETAIRLLDEFTRGAHQLLAPDIYPVELAHALAKAERKKIIHRPAGSIRLAELTAILPELHPSLPLLPRAFEIASAARIGVHDCIFVALAEREHCDLITADRKLILNLQKDLPFIVSLDSIRN